MGIFMIWPLVSRLLPPAAMSAASAINLEKRTKAGMATARSVECSVNYKDNRLLCRTTIRDHFFIIFSFVFSHPSSTPFLHQTIISKYV